MGFCRVLDPSCPSRVSNSLADLSFISSYPGEGATHIALLVGKEWTLFSCCIGVLPGASRKQSCKCISVFRCFKTQHCPSHFFPQQYDTIGWQRLLIGCSRSWSATGTISAPCLGVASDNAACNIRKDSWN